MDLGSERKAKMGSCRVDFEWVFVWLLFNVHGPANVQATVGGGVEGGGGHGVGVARRAV